VDFSRLPLPQIIEQLDVEDLVSRRIDLFKQVWEGLRDRQPDLSPYDVEGTPYDPVVILQEVGGYIDMIVLARINDAVRSTFLATATGTDLDNIAARYKTVRLEGEADRAFRERILLAYEALSTAGTYGGYEYHARSAHPSVADVEVYGPESGFCDPGQSLIVVMGKEGLGVPSAEVLTAVEDKLNDRDVRALTDEVLVQPVVVLPYVIETKLKVGRVPSGEALRQEAIKRVEGLVARRFIGRRVARSAIAGALHLIDGDGEPLISDIELVSPAADIVPTALQVASCSTISVDLEFVDD